MDDSNFNSDSHSNRTVPSVPDFRLSAGPVLGVGIDLVARKRVERMLGNHGERFLKRCFTDDEAAYCLSRPDPVPDLAVRLAVKEAAFKAIGGRRGMGLGWRCFEVAMDDEKIPCLRLRKAAKERGEAMGIGKLWISLTHEDDWSAAVVVITGKPGG